MRVTPIRFEGVHCSITIERPAPRVVTVRFEGKDAGELGDSVFRELQKDLDAPERLELFIDARHADSASVDVSSEWAIWLQTNKHRFRHVSMLTRSRFIQISAEFVKKFAQMGDVMRLYTDAATFDGAQSNSIANSLG